MDAHTVFFVLLQSTIQVYEGGGGSSDSFFGSRSCNNKSSVNQRCSHMSVLQIFKGKVHTQIIIDNDKRPCFKLVRNL